MVNFESKKVVLLNILQSGFFGNSGNGKAHGVFMLKIQVVIDLYSLPIPLAHRGATTYVSLVST